MTNTPSEENITAELAVSRKAPPLDPNKFILPVAILIAGIMISATIFYTSGDAKVGANNVGVVQATPAPPKLTITNLLKWAPEVGLDKNAFTACLDSGKYKAEVQKDIADGTAAGVNGTPSFFINGRAIVGAMPFATFKAVIDEELAKTPTKEKRVTVSVDDDPMIGAANAPVTIIEFSDFECPYCHRFFNETYGQIKQEYIDTGKVKLVYRDFPLSFHPGAEPAAEAGNCAKEQGKFWEYHDKVFQSQS